MSHAITQVFTYYASPLVEPAPERPWRLDVNGESWLWATEGHIIIGVKSHDDDSDPTPEKYVKGAKYLSDALHEPVSVHRKSLETFAGTIVPADIECDECGRSGRDESKDYVTCEHCGKDTRQECSACGGDGRGMLPSNDGLMFPNVIINRTYLSFALSLVPPSQAVTIGRLGNERYAFAVEGHGWRIVIMTLIAVDHSVAKFDPVEARA